MIERMFSVELKSKVKIGDTVLFNHGALGQEQIVQVPAVVVNYIDDKEDDHAECCGRANLYVMGPAKAYFYAASFCEDDEPTPQTFSLKK